MIRDHYDCIVIGGGPAGSCAAALVARAGFSTLLLERESMPRFHVGESLMPETYWVFQRLGIWEKLRANGFVEKYSVQFVAGYGNESQPFFFADHDPRPCSQTWQVERAKFDQLLFEHARTLGADCFDETRVQRVLFDHYGDSSTSSVSPAASAAGDLALRRDVAPVFKSRALGIELFGPADSQLVTSKVVIDATGQQSLIGNQIGIREPIPELRKAAVWTYYRGAERLPGHHGGATLVLHTQSHDAWFWYIPLADEITSIGVVSDAARLLRGKSSPQEIFSRELSVCPALQRRLVGAARIDEHRVVREFSYWTRQHAGDGWVLIGDAFAFIDPIYSSGVYFALKTGEMAADAVIEGLSKGDTSGAQLGKWTDEFKMGARWVRKLVDAFYSKTFSFGQFMREHPEHRGHVTDVLIGRVFQGGMDQLFRDLEAAIPRSRPDH